MQYIRSYSEIEPLYQDLLLLNYTSVQMHIWNGEAVYSLKLGISCNMVNLIHIQWLSKLGSLQLFLDCTNVHNVQQERITKCTYHARTASINLKFGQQSNKTVTCYSMQNLMVFTLLARCSVHLCTTKFSQ